MSDSGAVGGLPVVDGKVMARLREEIGEDLEIILGVYLEKLDERVASLRDSAAGEDPHALQVAAHLLKGSSQNVGAVSLATLCRDLEACAKEGDMAAAQGRLAELARCAAAVKSALAAEVAGSG